MEYLNIEYSVLKSDLNYEIQNINTINMNMYNKNIETSAFININQTDISNSS